MRVKGKRWEGCIRNKGYSLVELVVVIAIIAIIGGAGITMLSTLPRGQVNSCAKELALAIEKTRTTSMGLEAADITISYDADGVYTKLSTTKNGVVSEVEKTAGKEGIQIFYIMEGGTAIDLGANQLTLSFNRSSGAFQYPRFNGGGAESTYCTAIIIRKGGYERRLTLVPLTGKLVQE